MITKATTQVFPTTINYRLTLEDYLRMCKFSSIEPYLPVNARLVFRIADDIKETIVLLLQVPSNVALQSQFLEIDSKIRGAGYRPLRFQELLAFALEYPTIQLEFAIAGIASFFADSTGFFRVPVLCGPRFGVVKPERRLLFVRISEGNGSTNNFFGMNIVYAVVRQE